MVAILIGLQVRDTCARFVSQLYGVDCAREHTLVCAGGIQACYCTLALAIESPADVVLSTSPVSLLGCYAGAMLRCAGVKELVRTKRIKSQGARRRCRGRSNP